MSMPEAGSNKAAEAATVTHLESLYAYPGERGMSKRRRYELMRANGATDAQARALTDLVAAYHADDAAAARRSLEQFIEACRE